MRVLISVLVVGGVLYAAHSVFFANGVGESAKPASDSAGVGQAAAPKLDAVQVVEAAQESGAVEALEIAETDSPHAISVEDAPSQAPASESSPSSSAATAPSTAGAEASPEAKPHQAEFVRVTSPASIREGPSVSTAIVGIAHPGAEAQIVSRSSDWVQIIDPGSKKTGWIHGSFLEPQAEPASRPVSPEEVDAALAAPAETETAAADQPAVKAKSHKQGWKHRRHRRGIAWGFMFRRSW
jgi:hypothetical protein